MGTKPVKCRSDCTYWCKTTHTCDYRLLERKNATVRLMFVPSISAEDAKNRQYSIIRTNMKGRDYMYGKKYPDCGAYLDPCEPCDCRNEKTAASDATENGGRVTTLSEVYLLRGRLSSE